VHHQNAGEKGNRYPDIRFSEVIKPERLGTKIKAASMFFDLLKISILKRNETS
jgi:hypothetical protein